MPLTRFFVPTYLAAFACFPGDGHCDWGGMDSQRNFYLHFLDSYGCWTLSCVDWSLTGDLHFERNFVPLCWFFLNREMEPPLVYDSIQIQLAWACEAQLSHSRSRVFLFTPVLSSLSNTPALSHVTQVLFQLHLPPDHEHLGDMGCFYTCLISF